MLAILTFFRGIGGKLAIAGAAVLGIIIALGRMKKAGRDEAVAESAKKEIENVHEAQKVEREIAVTKPADVQQRLRDEWSRD